MGLRKHRSRRALTSLSLLVSFALGSGCGKISAPVLDPDLAKSEKTPVVFVPGVTGVGLQDVATDRLAWGAGSNLLRPHDRGYGTSRSVTERQEGPALIPAGVILNLRLFGVVRYRIYQQLVDLFVANGYQLGDVEEPTSGDNFFLFSYDWRQDNVDSAQRLASQLERLRQARGQAELRVNLICQSNGAHVCRYFTKYGSLDLEAAESGSARKPAEMVVEKLILVGASTGGSSRVLRESTRGRQYVTFLGRFWSPETLFTFASLSQDLPIYTKDLFVDQQAVAMPVDLYDVDNWKKYQWSIYGPKIDARLRKDDLPPWFGTGVERREFLSRALDRAQRFHGLLQKDIMDLGTVRYYLIANMENDTSSRAALIEGKNGWETKFWDDKQVRRDPALRAGIVVTGDGHATAESQTWLSLQEARWLGSNLLQASGAHRGLILQPQVHEQILQILAEPSRSGR